MPNGTISLWIGLPLWHGLPIYSIGSTDFSGGYSVNIQHADVPKVAMTRAERDERRVRFAYANAHIENPNLTIELFRQAIREVNAENGQG